MPGTLTLIGSGEFQPGLVATHRSILARLTQPRAVFLDTPAGFQTNADELSASAQTFFQAELGLPLALASLRHSHIAPEQIQLAKDQLTAANYLVAGPGSPTYALRHWRATGLGEIFRERLAAGAHLVFASSAVIALGRHALPVYEIFKVGDDPYWAPGLDLLNLDLALVPHWNYHEPRCFIGLDRFNALAAHLPETVIVGIDENTAVTLDFDSGVATVTGAGSVTLRYRGEERLHPAGHAFPLVNLTPAHALDPVGELQTSNYQLPITNPQLPASLYIPPALHQWATDRAAFRAAKNFAASDQMRDRIAQVGYTLKDSPTGPVFTLTQHPNSNAVPAQLAQPDTRAWSVSLLCRNNAAEILRAAQSVLRYAPAGLELIIVDDASDPATRAALADFACTDDRVRLVHYKDPLGEGAGRNAALRAARGQHVLILGGHMELTGDIFTPLAATLADETIGATGSNGLVTTDLFTFNPAPTPDCDAVEFYCFAFRRARLKQVGLLDEKFAFYRNLDLDWSLTFRAAGLRLITTPQLPLAIHEHPYLRMDPIERDKLSKKNYRKFLDKWKGRTDLLMGNAEK